MKKLNQREAWAKIAAEFNGGVDEIGLCYEIHRYEKTGLINYRVARGMFKSIHRLVRPDSFIWPVTEAYVGHRKTLAGLLAKGNHKGAAAFVTNTENQ